MTETAAEAAPSARPPVARHIELVDYYADDTAPFPVLVPGRILIDGRDVTSLIGYMPADVWSGWRIQNTQGCAASIALDFFPWAIRVTPIPERENAAHVDVLHPDGDISLCTSWTPGEEPSDRFTETVTADLREQGGNGPLTRERVWVLFAQLSIRPATAAERAEAAEQAAARAAARAGQVPADGS